MSQQPIGVSTNTQVLNITTAGSGDTLVVTLANQSGAALALIGGTPVAESAITAASASTFYLSFGTALTTAALKAIQVNAPGWRASCFTGMAASWGICPAANLTLPAGGTVTVTLTNVAVAGPPRPAQLNVDYYNVGSLADATTQVKLQIQNAPSGPQNLSVSLAFRTGDTVYTSTDPLSPIENTLYFTISNPSPTVPIVPASVAWNASPPIFNISFVYGSPPGLGALTTATLAATMSIEVINGGDAWTLAANTQSDSPYWTLQPTYDNHQVLGTGTSASVELKISQLVSDLPVGNDPDVTLMYVQYSNVPGYNDGFATLSITKVAGPSITSFWAEPASVPAGAASGPVTLHWTTNAGGVTFDAPQIGAAVYGPNGQGPLASPVVLDAGQRVTLTAYLAAPLTAPRTAAPGDATPLDSNKDAAPIAVQKGITILEVSSKTIDLGLEGVQELLALGPKVYAFQAGAAVVDGQPLPAHQFVEVTAATSAMATYDLNSALEPAEQVVTVVQLVCASADGGTIYAFLTTDSQSSNGDLLIVTVDTATNAMKQVYKESHYANDVSGAIVSPDGRALYWCRAGQPTSSEAGGFTVPTIPTLSISVLDTATFTLAHTYTCGSDFQPDAVSFLGLNDDASIGYMTGATSITVVDFAQQTILSNVSIRSLLPDSAFFCRANMLADGSRIFAIAVSITTAAASLVVVDVDPVTHALELLGPFPLGTQLGEAILSADEQNLFDWVSGDALQLINTQVPAGEEYTPLIQTVSCGLDDPPLATIAGEQPGVLYWCDGKMFTTLTITGLTSGTLAASRPASARPARLRSAVNARLRAAMTRAKADR